MKAAETIAAAIQKLEEQCSAAAQDGWTIRRNHAGNVAITWVVDMGDIDPPEAELIVALHRTIDAQLAFLRASTGGAQDVDEGASPDEPEATLHALTLARAILRGVLMKAGDLVVYVTRSEAYLGELTFLLIFGSQRRWAINWRDGFSDGGSTYAEVDLRKVVPQPSFMDRINGR